MPLLSFQMLGYSTPSRSFCLLTFRTNQVTYYGKQHCTFFSSASFNYCVFLVMCAEIQSLLGMVRHGMGSFLVFVGLDGSKEELGIVSTNFWMYKDNDLDSLYVF